VHGPPASLGRRAASAARMLRRPRRRDAAPPPAALRGRSRSSKPSRCRAQGSQTPCRVRQRPVRRRQRLGEVAVASAGVASALSRPAAARPTAAAAWRGLGRGRRGRRHRVAFGSFGGLARVGPAQRLPQLQRPGEGRGRQGAWRPLSAELDEGPRRHLCCGD